MINIFIICISCIIYYIIYGIKYFIKGKIFNFYEKVENVKGLTNLEKAPTKPKNEISIYLVPRNFTYLFITYLFITNMLILLLVLPVFF